ncbi:hypothetical protein LCGC14_1447970 [marine sediment metagenome]|uniref:Uncharacterized protein n=1 Tax=marine sediment metagenome TaxID=412755 RepID=A0A0F9K4W1_9ZZZZ
MVKHKLERKVVWTPGRLIYTTPCGWWFWDAGRCSLRWAGVICKNCLRKRTGELGRRELV